MFDDADENGVGAGQHLGLRHVRRVVENQARAATCQEQRCDWEQRAHLLKTPGFFGSSRTSIRSKRSGREPAPLGAVDYRPRTPSSAATDTQIVMWARKP